MSKGFRRPWEGNDNSCSTSKQQNEKKVEAEKCADTLSDEMQRAVLNCYDYNWKKMVENMEQSLRQVKL